ncbi:MAG: DUF4105 domain-containing protein [Tannerella sp.]|nr:DUF4105 domain-containing protein [Tannerella sp.]
MTSSPGDETVYTVYGHTALRVYDPGTSTDWVFNYGIFSFTKPNFIYRFAKGETDYAVRAYDFNSYLMEYAMSGREVCEQVLNLLPEEKEALWQALVWNERPENRVYRYNFFFDNCATRPVAMIEKNIKGTIKYPLQTKQMTFREAINYCTRNNPWTTFGCDLVLGMPTDQVMTRKETFFLPEYVKEAFNKSEIIRNGVAQPLVLKVNMLAEETLARDAPPPFFLSPLFCFTLLFIFILALTWNEWRRKNYYRLLDCLLFFIAGITGCILFFLSFISVHPSIFPNISLLWLHPFHLAGIILFSVKKFNIIAFWYHFINFAAILIMVVVWIFIPQHFNPAFIPLIAGLWLRSGMALLRKKEAVE